MLFLEEVTAFSCGGADVLRVLKFVFLLIDIVLFIVPMGLILILIVDFLKNVIAGKEDDMKKNVNVAIKRLGFAVVLFLIPVIVGFVISLLGNLGVDYAKCIEIAESEEDLWKYTIDWEYYPYDTEEPVDSDDGWVLYNYTKTDDDGNVENGSIKIYEDGRVVKQ